MQSASQTHKCNICSIVLINSAELSEHQTAVHIDKMFPFQSCDKSLDIKNEFENYMAKVHGNSQYTTTADYNKSIEQTLIEETDADGMGWDGMYASRNGK